MVKHLPLVFLPLWAASAFEDVADNDAFLKASVGRFQASKPAVVMSYDVCYTLASFRLKRVASATIQAVEGDWRSPDGARREPAYLIDFHVASPHAEQGNVRLAKRTMCVVGMSDLQIIRYAKTNDETIKPFFGRERRSRYQELYDFEAGALRYRHVDQLTGTVESNLVNMVEMVEQNKELAQLLRTLFRAYCGASDRPEEEPAKVHFNVDGTVVAFELATRKGRVAVPALERKVGALYADVQPVKGSVGSSESFSIWCVPFRDFAREAADPALEHLAETSLECSMLPLQGEYALFLGSLQCTLTNVCSTVF